MNCPPLFVVLLSSSLARICPSPSSSSSSSSFPDEDRPEEPRNSSRKRVSARRRRWRRRRPRHAARLTWGYICGLASQKMTVTLLQISPLWFLPVVWYILVHRTINLFLFPRCTAPSFRGARENRIQQTPLPPPPCHFVTTACEEILLCALLPPRPPSASIPPFFVRPVRRGIPN